jgi:hypothetical protein
MPPSDVDPLGAQLREIINKAILRLSKNDPRRAIANAEKYLRWVRRVPTPDALVEEQKFAAVSTLRKLIAVLKARSPKDD